MRIRQKGLRIPIWTMLTAQSTTWPTRHSMNRRLFAPVIIWLARLWCDTRSSPSTGSASIKTCPPSALFLPEPSRGSASSWTCPLFGGLAIYRKRWRLVGNNFSCSECFLRLHFYWRMEDIYQGKEITLYGWALRAEMCLAYTGAQFALFFRSLLHTAYYRV